MARNSCSSGKPLCFIFDALIYTSYMSLPVHRTPTPRSQHSKAPKSTLDEQQKYFPWNSNAREKKRRKRETKSEKFFARLWLDFGMCACELTRSFHIPTDILGVFANSPKDEMESFCNKFQNNLKQQHRYFQASLLCLCFDASVPSAFYCKESTFLSPITSPCCDR